MLCYATAHSRTQIITDRQVWNGEVSGVVQDVTTAVSSIPFTLSRRV